MLRPTILVILALLGGVVGCGSSRSDPVTASSGGIEIAASVEPAELRVGENAMWIEVRDAQGAPVSGAHVNAIVQMHAMGAMPAMGGSVPVRELGDGRYRADFELEMGGTWNVAIEVHPQQGPTARAEGSLTVGAPGLRLEGDAADAAGGPELDAHSDAPQAGGRHPAEIRVPTGRQQRVGVRTAPAETKALRTTLRAVGRVIAEEATLADVSLKIRGWVGEIYADAVGEPVREGETLFTVYSPELYAAQEEYLQALRSQERARASSAPDRVDYLVRAARNRLRLWDISERELEGLAESGQPVQHLPIRAPVSGYVVEKNLVEGSAFQPGERLYRIAPLSRVWIEAEIYEYELPLVRAGQPATVTLPYLPDSQLETTVAYVYPTLDPETRTARLRLEIPNPELELRPDMYANVRIHVDRGERLVVPQSAVLHAGERDFVFRSLGDGRFRPQAVKVGLRSGDDVEILSGIEPGDPIVVSGTFLIASESRLRAAMEQW